MDTTVVIGLLGIVACLIGAGISAIEIKNINL